MTRCNAITAAGSACKGTPMPHSEYCYVHDPSTLEERKRHGSKGGRRGGRGRQSPVSRELARLQAVFERLAERIESGEIERGTAAVMIQAYNGARSCAAAMLKARELEELEERIIELEERYQHENGAYVRRIPQMSRLSARLDRIAGPRRCPKCGFPGPLPRDIEVKTVVRVTELDEEGRPLPTPPVEPEYCEGCGRPMPVIRMQPLDEKTRGT